MEFVFEEFSDRRIGVMAQAQGVVTAEINTAERGGVSRILSVSAEGKLFTVEALEGEARLSGKVNFKLLYLDEEGKPAGLDYFSDFEETVKNPSVSPAVKLWGDVVIIETESEAEESSIRLSAVCAFAVRGVAENKLKAMTQAVGCEALDGTVKLCTVTPLPERGFTLTEEAESGVSVDKVLLFGSRIIAEDIVEIVGGVKVSGRAFCDVVFSAEGQMYYKSMTVPFSEEAECEGGLMQAEAVIKSSRLVLSGAEDNNVIKAELSCCLKLTSVTVTEQKMITDVFSETEEIAVTCGGFCCKDYIGSSRYNQKITAEIPIEGDNVSVTAALAGKVTLANLLVENGSIVAEGVACVSLIYTDGNGAEAVDAELPFSLVLGSLEDGVVPEGEAVIASVAARAVGGAVEVRTELSIRIDRYLPVSVCCVEYAEASGVKRGDGAGISVYFADEKDTLWSVAKAVGASPSRLLSINPELENGVTAGKKIVVFREKRL